MFSKKDCVIIASVGYLVLIMLNKLTSVKRNYTRDLCSYDSPCVRFCCRDQETCNATFLKMNFNADINLHLEPTIQNMKDLDYKIMFGEPTCGKRQIKNQSEWKMNKNGEIFIDGYYRNHEEYCFQDLTADKGSVSFDLHVCGFETDFRLIINNVAITISVLLLIATILIFVFCKEIRTSLSGKIEFCLVTCALLSFAFICFMELDILEYLLYFASYGLGFSFIFLLSSMTLLNFDVWWTTRNHQETSDGAERFKFYCLFVFGTVFTIVLTRLAKEFLLMYGLFNYVWLSNLSLNLACDIVFLVMTSVILFRLSRSANFSNHSWLEVQLERFWINVQLFVILMITCLMKTNSRETDIIPDITICYSASLLFIIFATKKANRRIFSDNYKQLRSNSTQNATGI